MNNKPATVSAVEVIRWVYLARELQQRGHEDAAELWYAKASQWMHQKVYEPKEVNSGGECEKTLPSSSR